MSSINILHTSDWHLGKRLFRRERETEHALFLQWLEATLKDREIDILLVAGDIFDSPTPPHSSLKLYYDFLKRVADLGVQTLIISGNHDSQGLIGAPQNLLEEKKIIFASKLETDSQKNTVKLTAKKAEIWIKCMPYFRNYELIKMSQEFGLFDDELPREEVFKETLDQFFGTWPNGKPLAKLLLAHHVFGNYSSTGSEHFIGLSGIESIPLSMLKDRFDYAALGHIHKYQQMGEDPPAVYTGSPIQMRFSENKQKFVSHINVDTATAALSVQKVQIPVFRELLQVKTDSENYIEDLKSALEQKGVGLPPFVEVQAQMLEAKSAMADTLKEICERYGAELLSFLPVLQSADWEQGPQEDVSKLNIMDLFRKFYKEKFPDGEGPAPYLEEHFRTLLEEAKKGDF